MKREKILVTGATGFIGQHLVKRLIEEEAEVYAVSKRGGKVKNVSVDPLDLTSTEEINEYTKDKEFDAVFHLSAFIPVSFLSDEAESSFYANIQMTKNVLDILRKQRGGKFIYASSASVYNKVKKDIILTEELNVWPDNFYTISKYTGELLAEMYRQAFGITSISLRISAPYGPGNLKHTVINIFIEKALRGENLVLFGTGERRQDFTYISDVIDALMLSYKKEVNGVFNIASGESTPMKEVASLVLEAIPGTSSQIVFSRADDSQEGYYPNISLHNSKRFLGYAPKICLREGLKRTISTLKERLE